MLRPLLSGSSSSCCPSSVLLSPFCHVITPNQSCPCPPPQPPCVMVRPLPASARSAVPHPFSSPIRLHIHSRELCCTALVRRWQRVLLIYSIQLHGRCGYAVSSQQLVHYQLLVCNTVRFFHRWRTTAVRGHVNDHAVVAAYRREQHCQYHYLTLPTKLHIAAGELPRHQTHSCQLYQQTAPARCSAAQATAARHPPSTHISCSVTSH